MSAAKFDIETNGVTFTDKSRTTLKEQFDLIRSQPGRYDVSITPAKDKRTATRYKYYFDCVMWQILNECGNMYQTLDPKTGELTTPKNTEDMHWCMKCLYNRKVLIVNGEAFPVAASTTDMSDTEFIGKFLEANIIPDHSGPPYLIEFISYEDWKGLHAANAWKHFKNTYKPQT